MREKIISWVKKYAIAFAILGISSWVILSMREQSKQTEAAVIFLNLADAFTIPSVVIVMVGIMVWISTTGFFDILNYGISRAVNTFIPFKRYDDVKFYDYKMKKAEKRISGYSFLFISGAVYFVPAIIFLILYHQNI